MAKLTWHNAHDRKLEAGVEEVILFPMGNEGYEDGVAWNGVTAVNENPSGADITDLYADNIKYASMRSAEKFGFRIEAYNYPDEWVECDGSKEVVSGVFFGQQFRKLFGLCYKTKIGDETSPSMDYGYKLHIIYNCTASPSGKGYTTINDNPDAISFSWEADSTPVPVTGHKDTCEIVVDSTKADPDKLADLIDLLYGTAGTDSALPDPDTVLSTLHVET